MTSLPLVIRPERPGDADSIERLHARAFGPGRFARTAYRLREGTAPLADLCFTALVGTYLVGSVRLGPAEAQAPLLVLGPLTVDPSFEGRGIGGALMRRAWTRPAAPATASSCWWATPPFTGASASPRCRPAG